MPNSSQTHKQLNPSNPPAQTDSSSSSPNSATSDSSDSSSRLEQPGSRIDPKVGDLGSEKSTNGDTEQGQQASKEVQEGWEEDEEEQGECGFCLFMKSGRCKDSFVAWENCIQEAEKNKEDIVEKCVEITGVLKKCMDAHSEYYVPILRAEKGAEEEALIEFEKVKAASQDADQNPAPKGVEDNLG